MKRQKQYWRICVILVIFLMVLTYTPAIIPAGVYKPAIFGIPYSLWTSFLVTAALVTLTYIGSKVHPGNDNEEGDS